MRVDNYQSKVEFLNEKSELFQLWWFDPTTGKNLPAGVAFHDEKFGEYRLKIDMLPDSQIYLRPLSTQEQSVYYRAEVAIKRNGKFVQRKQVGEGWSSTKIKGDAFINLGPFSKFLVLGLKKLKQKNE
jgi:hypothetical protein